MSRPELSSRSTWTIRVCGNCEHPYEDHERIDGRCTAAECRCKHYAPHMAQETKR
jgi:hypothetical protein